MTDSVQIDNLNPIKTTSGGKRKASANLLPPIGTGRRVTPAQSATKPKKIKPKPEESTKVMTELKKVLGYTKKKTLATLMLTQADIDAAERLLLALNTEQLKKLVETQKSFFSPIGIYLATYAKKLLVDLKDGKTEGVDKLRLRQYKANNPSIEHTGGNATVANGGALKIEIVGADGVAQELNKLLDGDRLREGAEIEDAEALIIDDNEEK